MSKYTLGVSYTSFERRRVSRRHRQHRSMTHPSNRNARIARTGFGAPSGGVYPTGWFATATTSSTFNELAPAPIARADE